MRPANILESAWVKRGDKRYQFQLVALPLGGFKIEKKREYAVNFRPIMKFRDEESARAAFTKELAHETGVWRAEAIS